MASTMYINPNTNAKAGTYGSPASNGGQNGYYIPGGAPSYIRSNADMSGYRSAYEYGQANNVAPRSIKTTDTRYGQANTPLYGPFSSQSGPSYYGGGYGGGGYGGYGFEQPDYSPWFNMMTDIQNAKHDAQVKLAERLKQATDDNINLGAGYNLREWKKMYGDKRNGQGLSNKLNIFYDRDRGLRENEANYQNNLLQAKAGQFTDLSGLTGQLANMDNNTIKKIMSHVSSL